MRIYPNLNLFLFKTGSWKIITILLYWNFTTVFLMIRKRDRDRRVHERPHKNDRQWDIIPKFPILSIFVRTLRDATVMVTLPNHKKDCIIKSMTGWTFKCVRLINWQNSTMYTNIFLSYLFDIIVSYSFLLKKRVNIRLSNFFWTTIICFTMVYK